MPIPETRIIDPADFPDRLSPMLVKELRQGLRTHLFVSAFILLQVFMILCILMVASDPGANTAANGFFWFFIYLVFIIVQPLRGVGALSSEYQVNTMDLIRLTRLTSWRITWGKWCAINAQTLLFTVSVLPYLVLRYFFGAVNVIADIGWLGLFLGASALLSAATVGCSAFRSIIVRIVLLIGIGVGFALLHAVGWELSRYRGRPTGFAEAGLVGFACLFGIPFFLLLGASRIATGSENHATMSRLLGLIFAAGAWSFRWLGVDEDMCIAFSGVILGFTLIGALTEPPPVFQPVLRPFSGNFLTRACAGFLTPGWHSAVIFFVFPCLILWFGMWSYDVVVKGKNINDEMMSMAVCLPAMLLFPLIPIHLFMRKTTNSHAQFSAYLFIQLGVVIVTFFAIAVLESTSHKELVALCVPLPSVILFGIADNKIEEGFLIIALFWLVLSLVIPLIHARPLFKEMSSAFRRIREEKNLGTH